MTEATQFQWGLGFLWLYGIGAIILWRHIESPPNPRYDLKLELARWKLQNIREEILILESSTLGQLWSHEFDEEGNGMYFMLRNPSVRGWSTGDAYRNWTQYKVQQEREAQGIVKVIEGSLLEFKDGSTRFEPK